MNPFVSEQAHKSALFPAKKKQRFHQATAEGQNARVEPPCLQPDQKLMGQLLTPEVLTQLPRRYHQSGVGSGQLRRRPFRVGGFGGAGQPEPPPAPVTTGKPIGHEATECLRATWGNKLPRAFLFSGGTGSFFGNSWCALYGLYTIRELGMGPAALGLTIAMGGTRVALGGAGVMLGTMSAAVRGTAVGGGLA